MATQQAAAAAAAHIAQSPVIQFNKYNVVNKTTGAKARVFYSRYTPIGQSEECICLTDKEYGEDLFNVFLGVDLPCENNTDIRTDYFDRSRVRIVAGHRLFESAAAAHARKPGYQPRY